MDADLLLRWMSENGAGSVRELRERIDWLARTGDLQISRTASGRWVRAVTALGHAEVLWDRDRWAMTPPAIARLPAADGTGVVAGSRRTGFIERLQDADLAVHITTANPAAGDLATPAAVHVQFDSVEALRRAAIEVGAQYVGCAATKLAARLPGLSLGPPAAPPSNANESLERFIDSERMTFVPSRGDMDGLYRLRLAGRHTHLYRGDSDWYHCDLPSGIFIEHNRNNRSVIRWRHVRDSGGAKIGTFFVDGGFPLPALHTRALTLCSGLPARSNHTTWTDIYINIPYKVAVAVAASLSQTLQSF